MNKFLILPSCDDGNRGDQALVWETKKQMENAGYIGDYYMLGEKNNCIQSAGQKIEIISPILRHPSRKFKNKNNSVYGFKLLTSWGTVAILDFLFSKIVYNNITRKIFECFFPKSIKKTLEIMRSCDVCFVKGGGFIHSYGKVTDIYAIYYNLFHIKFMQKIGKKIYVMPNSFGPFLTKGVQGQVVNALSSCEEVFARESISLEALKKIGVNAKLFPDLGFGLSMNSAVPYILQEAINHAGNRKMIGITVRPYRFEGYEKYVNEMTRFIKLIMKNGYFPVLVEQVISECDNESDIKCIFQISEKLNKNDFFVISDRELDCKKLKMIYSKMHTIIGTRFHSVIFALSQRVPCVAIAYGGNKGLGIMRDIGLEDYCINLEDVTSDLLYEKFFKIEKNRFEYLGILDIYFEKSESEMKKMKNLMQHHCLIDLKKDEEVL